MNPNAEPRRRPRVLAVDPDHEFLETVKKLLASCDLDLEPVVEVDAALRKLQSEPFDLLVCDVFLEGLRGPELCRAGKAAETPVPVIFVSALFLGDAMQMNAHLGELRERFLRQADIVMPKPLDAAFFLNSVGEILRLPTAPEAPDEGGMQILAVDDSAPSLELLKDELSEFQFTVTGAGSAEEAFRAIEEKGSFDAVLLDYLLKGGETGLEILPKIRNRLPNAAFLMVTAYGSEEVAVEALKGGADDYVQKPYDAGRLATTLRAHIAAARDRADRSQLAARLHETTLNLFDQVERLEKANEEISRAQRQLVESERFTAIGEIAAQLAHEINNPISAICGYADLAAIGMEPDHPSRSDIEKILREARRVASIVSKMVKFATGARLDLAAADLAEIVRRSLDEMDRGGRLRELKFEIADFTKTPHIVCDAMQLEEAFACIVENAAEATDGRGMLKISIAGPHETPNEALPDAMTMMPLSAREQKGFWAAVTFADDGRGIAKSDLTQIFAPFFSRGGEIKGVGLGLPMALGIVRSHKGAIAVRSKPGEGAVFCVVLPLAP